MISYSWMRYICFYNDKHVQIPIYITKSAQVKIYRISLNGGGSDDF